ncbi:SDR family oxidoreductase [Mycolicibacterium chubuense]|jgi:NAD(P)-dependent dehydrogenase (short-subunit alcohol dehydrogenase family)|uniref:3-oxoacyl-[acyl-carrier-protein] reductase FabG n=1 Tax=Mycolicibacterium chubuense TaxID=1800 RepID=A0A0J6YKN3_MYCCU|nr:SDR family oxidoreductase [Mycolicibacterium chubuense]KMO73356.1 3-oxoacyl-[acyl-carrier-protein] reductase FabG [Mycolicibacterium chubuense]ORA56658.1 SDR family oxidoreductase [Mycolicibacterium chubuense]SPX98890.1 short-chain dehydrogenase/reductase SDR [Mycolicibacterium chubuense]
MIAPELQRCAALVTDGTSGPGLAVARLLRNAGAHVVVSGRDPVAGKIAASHIGGGTRFIAADLTDLATVDHLARQMPVDILINNAAVTDIDQLTGLYFLVATIAPGMVRHGGGAIVNVVSGTGAPVTALTRTWAAEFGADGIRINSVVTGERPSPLGRVVEPTDIAEATVFLASPRASYITGATLLVDGGAAVL